MLPRQRTYKLPVDFSVEENGVYHITHVSEHKYNLELKDPTTHKFTPKHENIEILNRAGGSLIHSLVTGLYQIDFVPQEDQSKRTVTLTRISVGSIEEHRVYEISGWKNEFTGESIIIPVQGTDKFNLRIKQKDGTLVNLQSILSPFMELRLVLKLLGIIKFPFIIQLESIFNL